MNQFAKVLFPDSWTFMRNLIVLPGIILLIFRIVMTMKGVAGGATINLKTFIFEGKLQTGTIGLLFAFLGFVLLLFCLWSRVTSKIEVRKGGDGSVILVHKGAFTRDKAENIARVIGIKAEHATTQNDESDE